MHPAGWQHSSSLTGRSSWLTPGQAAVNHFTRSQRNSSAQSQLERRTEPGNAASRSTHRHADQAAQHTPVCGKLKHSHGHFSVSIWGWSKLSAARHCTQRSATMRGPSTPVCVALAGRGSSATSCPECRAHSSPHKMQVLIHPPKSQQGSKGFLKTKCRKTLQAASHP